MNATDVRMEGIWSGVNSSDPKTPALPESLKKTQR
jgi:hypothetical protein